MVQFKNPATTRDMAGAPQHVRCWWWQGVRSQAPLNAPPIKKHLASGNDLTHDNEANYTVECPYNTTCDD